MATTTTQGHSPQAPLQTTALATAQPQPNTHVNQPAFASENYPPDESNTTVANLPPQPVATRNAAIVTSQALTSQAVPWEAPPQSHATPTPVEPTPVEPTPAIVLQIDNVRPNQGKIKVAVFTDPDSFLVKDRATTTLELPDATQVVTAQIDIKQLCAIAVFQDIDGNGELTRNRRGIPVEPCGFSNNAMIKRGPPKFADAAVNPGSDSPTNVLIRLP